MNVAEVLRRRAEQFRDDAAILDVHRGGPRRLTFGELEQAAGRTAALLREAGLRCGDTALVMHAMSAELYVATAAIFRLGLVAMFVDPSAGLRFIERCCRLRPPRCVLGAARAHLLAWLSPSLRRVPVKLSTGIRIPGTVALRSAERLKDDAGVLPCEPETPALISFTSGSGGQPKAMLRTHGFLLAQHRVLERALELRRGEVELATLPIFVLANLGSGVTSVLPDADLRRPDAIDAAPVIAQIRQHAASRVAASPALLERLADYCERRRALLPNVRKWLTGGGPVSPRLLARLQSLAPQSHVTLVYGATEVEPIATLCSEEIDDSDRRAMQKGGGLLAGRPVSSLQLRIVRDQWGRSFGSLTASEFERLSLPAGEAGEIVVSGQHVLTGRLGGAQNEANQFLVSGVVWHRTGDAGYCDPRGRLWLLGRCQARLEDGRGELYPLGVEQAALQQANVRRAALLSVRGRRVLAVEPSCEAARLDVDLLRKSLAFAQLDAVQILKRIPVDARHNAKIDYETLRIRLEKMA